MWGELKNAEVSGTLTVWWRFSQIFSKTRQTSGPTVLIKNLEQNMEVSKMFTSASPLKEPELFFKLRHFLRGNIPLLSSEKFHDCWYNENEKHDITRRSGESTRFTAPWTCQHFEFCTNYEDSLAACSATLHAETYRWISLRGHVTTSPL